MNPRFGFPMYRRPSYGGSDAADSGFSVREAQFPDLPLMADLLTDSFHSREGLMGWAFPLLRMGIYEDLRHRLRDCIAPLDGTRSRSDEGRYVCFVALAAGVGDSENGRPLVVGTVEISLRSSFSLIGFGNATSLNSGDGSGSLSNSTLSDFGSQYPYVSNLAVDAAWRRLGVAKLLLAACETVAVQWGYPALYLHVLESNHHARRLYFKVGYRFVSVDAGLSCWLFGQPRRILLAKSVNL